MDRWRDKVTSGKMTIEKYAQLRVDPPNSAAGRDRLKQQNYNSYRTEMLPGTVLMECYPAELLTTQEVTDAVGIVW